MTMGGVMQYIALDVANLKKWFAGTTGTTGTDALNNNGYIVYFSDRRGKSRQCGNSDAETGEYGFEDQVNSTTTTGDAGRRAADRRGHERQRHTAAVREDSVDASAAIFRPARRRRTTSSTNSTPTAPRLRWRNAGQARVNKVVLFRRALKLVNGGIVGGVNSLPTTG